MRRCSPWATGLVRPDNVVSWLIASLPLLQAEAMDDDGVVKDEQDENDRIMTGQLPLVWLWTSHGKRRRKENQADVLTHNRMYYHQQSKTSEWLIYTLFLFDLMLLHVQGTQRIYSKALTHEKHQ